MSYKKSIDEINLYYKQSGIAKKMLLLESIGLGAIAEYVHSGVLEDKSLLAGSSVVFASIIYNILKGYKSCDKYLESVDFHERNKDTEEELRKLYDEYLSIITKIISNYNFDDSLELCYTLYFLLDEGYFSKDNSYERYIHKLKREEVSDLKSTYIMEGKACCRHNTQFLADIFKKLNIPNYKITCTFDERIFSVKREYHEVNAIVDDKGKYTFDFSLGDFYVIDDHNKRLFQQEYKDEDLNEIKRKCLFKILNNFDYHMIDTIEDIKSRFIDLDEAVQNGITVSDIAENIKGDLTAIEDVTQPLKEEIAAKSLILMPRR